ncbi:MAG: hypothetical protein JWN83_1610 [Chitinophagaceae bacterium]|nr:hypothetical protein [Chitinophagaceae bacterium]
MSVTFGRLTFVLVFHRILDFKWGWIFIRAPFFIPPVPGGVFAPLQGMGEKNNLR